MSSLNIRVYDSTAWDTLQAQGPLWNNNTSLYISRNWSDIIWWIYTIVWLPSDSITSISADVSLDTLLLKTQSKEIELSLSSVLWVCWTQWIMFSQNIQWTKPKVYRTLPELTSSYIQGKKTHEIIVSEIKSSWLKEQFNSREHDQLFINKLQTVRNALAISLDVNSLDDQIQWSKVPTMLAYISTFPEDKWSGLLSKIYSYDDGFVELAQTLLTHIKSEWLDQEAAEKFVKNLKR